MGRKLFCEISPTAYKISVCKGVILRSIQDALRHEKMPQVRNAQPLPHIVKSHSSLIVRHLDGVDLQLQQNKKVNLQLAADAINGTIIRPGETFSVWNAIGHPTEKRGFREGLTISGTKGLGKGVGGGLCQVANMIHWLVLHSTLTVTEMHHHSDALFPDERRRVPFGTGTSIFYKALDYRFRNDTAQDVQLLMWLEDGFLCGELRSEHPMPYSYRIVEEDHHFRKEGDQYYRISRVYRIVTDRETGAKKKELILNNHSKVLYDPEKIPKEQIRND